MKIVQKLSLLLVAFILVFSAVPAFAEGILTSPTIIIPAPTCANFTSTLRLGSRSADVTTLQNFLHAKGYLSVTATGYFGPLTLKAVKAFQLASASGAVDGIVGVQTRAHIFAASCTVSTPVSQAPTITAMSPSSGPVGTVVTLTGSNFTPTGNIVHFAIGGIGNISSFVIPSTDSNTSPQASAGPALQQLSFTVPSSIGPYCKPDQACAMYVALLNAGTYPVSVENANGTSAAVSFTIIGNATMIPN